MANPITYQKSMGKYLWYSLLNLGFNPEAETSNLAGKTTVKYINLGVHMFDKPNKDAFYIVTHFLLHKLDPTRFTELYSRCWPVYDRKGDAEFRKITLSWLREIVDENSKSAPKVLASLFLSPGGPKFTALILHLAKHVMLQEMKTFTTADGSWYPEEAARPASSLNVAMKRLQLTKTRLLKSAVRQDNLLQEYQRRAQTLVKSIKEIRSEGAKYDQLLKCRGDEMPTEEDASAQKLNQVRSLWSAVDQMLSALKEEQRSVASVLAGDADQYSLDGADLALKIPPALLERIQRSAQQLSSGSVYEAGQLNPLCTLELMNHALQLLTEERSLMGGHAPLAQLRPQELQTRSGQAARVLEQLKVLRQRISKEEIPAVRDASLRLDLDWDRRWQETLSATPLASFLSDDPALCFLSPMAPLSFEPASEAACSAGVFARYPAKLGAGAPDEEVPAEVEAQAELVSGLPQLNRSTVCPAPPVRAECPAAAVPFNANSSLADLLRTLSPPPGGPSPSPPPPSPPPPPVQQARDQTVHTGRKAAPTKNKAKILDREFDNLASQYAEVITKTSPADGKWRDLDSVLCSLGGDPFSTRKQLHRTPESLIEDVKSSWRKAVEESKLRATAPSPQPCAARAPPSALSFNTTPCVPKPGPPRPLSTSLVSPPAWPSPGTGARRRGPGATDSNVVPFSLCDETLPEMASSDSLPSLSDEDLDADLLLLSPFSAPPTSLLDLDNDEVEASFRGTGPPYPGSTSGWLLEPDTAAPPGSDTLFSLDLEGLTPPRQEYSLPKLVTFSPMDDL